MDYSKDFSVIIPHRNSLSYLTRLLDSIPLSDQIEVILVDNSPVPITRERVSSRRPFTLLHSDPSRGAGGARNEGIDYAQGRWLLFADADDFYTEQAFHQFQSNVDSQADLIFFSVDAIFQDTGQHSVRGDMFTELVQDFLSGKTDEYQLRLNYSSPWAKMVSHALVDRHRLRFDEVPACNDKFFSMLCGYYAKTIAAVDAVVYMVTVTQGSLTQRTEFTVVYSRLLVNLRFNQFLRQHHLSAYQSSVMNWLLLSAKARPWAIPKLLWDLFRYRQSPFIGSSNWLNTLRNYRRNNEQAKKA